MIFKAQLLTGRVSYNCGFAAVLDAVKPPIGQTGALILVSLGTVSCSKFFTTYFPPVALEKGPSPDH